VTEMLVHGRAGDQAALEELISLDDALTVLTNLTSNKTES